MVKVNRRWMDRVMEKMDMIVKNFNQKGTYFNNSLTKTKLRNLREFYKNSDKYLRLEASKAEERASRKVVSEEDLKAKDDQNQKKNHDG